MTNKRPSQCERVLQYIKDHGYITQLDALVDISVMRLASRISELRKKGYKIARGFVRAKNRYDEPIVYAKYFFEEQE